MNKNIKKAALFTIPVLGLALISGGVVLAAPLDENGERHFMRVELTQEQKDVLEQAKVLHDAGDNEGARALLQENDIRPPRGEKPEFTDAQKAILDEAKALREAGDKEGAKALLEANDIRPPFMKGKGNMDRENHGAEVRAAVEAGDYAAFLKATENAPFADQVTESFFNTFGEAQDLREAGDHEGAKALMESIGLKRPEHRR